MLTSKIRYGMQALLELSIAPANRSLQIHEIASARGIPEKYLQQILGILKSAHLVTSKKGPGGGFLLNRLPESLSIAEIVDVLDPQWSSMRCPVAADPDRCGCDLGDTCPISALFGEIADSIEQSLRATTLATLRNQELELRQASALTYFI